MNEHTAMERTAMSPPMIRKHFAIDEESGEIFAYIITQRPEIPAVLHIVGKPGGEALIWRQFIDEAHAVKALGELASEKKYVVRFLEEPILPGFATMATAGSGQLNN